MVWALIFQDSNNTEYQILCTSFPVQSWKSVAAGPVTLLSILYCQSHWLITSRGLLNLANLGFILKSATNLWQLSFFLLTHFYSFIVLWDMRRKRVSSILVDIILSLGEIVSMQIKSDICSSLYSISLFGHPPAHKLSQGCCRRAPFWGYHDCWFLLNHG